MQLLIVEDEIRLAETLGEIMREQKYQVDLIHDGAEGYEYAKQGSYDVIILDVMLPGMDGFQIARKIREDGIDTPILMLTARGGITDKVSGLDCGADDYMTKPFSPEELLARIRALSRRQGEVVLEEMHFSDLTLNLSTNTLACGVKSVHLGYKECEVLKLLMARPAVIVPKEELITKIWGFESGAEDNNAEAYISFLRKKLLFLDAKAGIGTVRKVGYRLEAMK